MRIAFVAPANSTHTVKWVNALYKKGIDVVLFSLECHCDATKEINNGIEVVYLPGKNALAYYTAAPVLKNYLKHGDFDVVNAHYASGYGTLARMARAYPLLLNVWGSDVYEFPYQNKINHIILLRNLKNADYLASTSRAMADQTNKLLGKNKQIFITPFGVETTRFNLKNYDDNDKKSFTVGIVKLLEEVYSIDVLIKAFALFKDQYSGEKSINLDIYGYGSKEQELKELAIDLNIEDVVSFKGRIPNSNVPDVLLGMDAYVLTSSSESFGVSAVEAMAAALPVIATSVPGFREIVEDGKTGFIVPVGDYQQIATLLLKLADEDELCKKLGYAGRNRAQELYDWDKNVDTMIKIYTTISK